MKLSIVIPIYNGSSTIISLVEAVKLEMKDIDYELILVNDGSTDGSGDICEELAYQDDKINYIALRNNFGEHNAVVCGLNACSGDYAVIIDDDFQNPPSEIKKLLREAAVNGYDVVYSKYKNKHHGWFRNFGSKWTNLIASYVLNKPFSLYLSSFKIIKKDVVREIVKYKGASTYIDGLLLRVTSNIGVLEVEHSPRVNGKSNYNLSRLFSLYMSMFINHSIRPIRFFMFVGFIMFMSGIVSFFYFLESNLMETSPSLNWKLFLSGSFALSGFNAVILGVIGEYIGKIILNSGVAPQYVVKKMIVHNGAKSNFSSVEQ
ncbi:MAG TPA: glycosyltransferase family 2 protein [Cytophagaceae bacterium]|jgi:glycosyltransferase involved in cell wall biosynthesis|nr:glycosyltransferase family 2 protein [Cytophagaceae bacterium]